MRDGSISLCADKITMNKVLKDDRFKILNVEDIFDTTMAGGRIFSTLDIREAYLHMLVDVKGAEIQTTSTTKSY